MATPLKRGARAALATGLIAAGLTIIPSTPALADPAPPASASDAEKQLADLGLEAEVVTEKMHDAQIAVDSAKKKESDANTRLGQAKDALAAARTEQDRYRQSADQLAESSFQGARLNRLSALMTSESPQELLDQMAGLDLLASDTTDQIERFAVASVAATKATNNATAAKQDATSAVDAASTAQTDLVAQQAELKTRTSAVETAFDRLTTQEKEAYAGPSTPEGYVAPVADEITDETVEQPAADDGGGEAPAPEPAPVPSGSGSASQALQAALGKVGSPYVWGATGPNSFDCSGLSSWAYAQAGVTIPRSSSAQSQSGTPVSQGDLQPGDLVFFYSPVSHVGLYAGNGNVVHAPTFGQGVKVQAISQMEYNSARRY